MNSPPKSASRQPALLVADTDATQSYVFESNKLPEIRGASCQLDDLNQEIGKLVRDKGGKVIFAGGGSLLARIDYAEGVELAAKIEKRYPDKTGVATISAAFRLLPPDYKRYKPFGTYVRWAGQWLRRHKEGKAAPPFFETLPHQAVCFSCQKRPSNARYLEKIPDWPICTVCYEKWQVTLRRGQATDNWYGRFDAWLDENPNLRANYYRTYAKERVDAPQTVSEIAEIPRGRQGYVGFIYLDGDSIGELLGKMPEINDYASLSEKLSTVTREAVYHALATELEPAEVEGSELRAEVGQGSKVGQKIPIHPFEIITIGGDDVLLIVPSYAAIPIARCIGTTFEDRMTPEVRRILGADTPRTTMSAGVVIAENHTPIQMQFELASQLLKQAKRTGGALDFHILKSADMVDRTVSAIREQYPYTIKAGGRQDKDLRLLARPYRYPAMRDLWDGLQGLKAGQFPTSQMNLLARALLDGRSQATLFYHYQKARHQRNRNTYDQLEQLMLRLQSSALRDPLPWQAVADEEYSHQTVLWDIAELYDFVP